MTTDFMDGENLSTGEDGGLRIGGLDCEELAREFGTPLYVMNSQQVRRRYRQLRDAFDGKGLEVRINYACKANTSLAILKILNEEGAGIDAVSAGEVYLAMQAGFTPDRILYTGTSVSDNELRFLIDANVPINIDSPSQIDRLLKICGEDGKP